MPEPVIYMRGFPPPAAVIARHPEMLEDLSAVANLTSAQVEEIREQLTNSKGYLDRNALVATIRKVVSEEDIANALRRVMQNLDATVLQQTLEALSDARDQEGFPLDTDALAKLRQFLPILIQPYPALTRFKKAERLATLTGQELESIELICDLRPIFDEDRKHVEGMMPYTRLRLVATGADGLPSSFEVELTHQQVSDLVSKASKAEDKLLVLREQILNWTPYGMPTLPLTQTKKKDV